MEILVITWNYPPRRGGIEYLVSNLCMDLRKRHSVVVVTSHASPVPVEEDIFRTPFPGLIPFALYALWRGAMILLRNRKIKVIFGGSAMVTPLVLVLARLFGGKAVIQAHGLDLVYPNTLYQLSCVRWVKYCDRVIANSTYTALLAKEKGARGALVSVIPPGSRSSLGRIASMSQISLGGSLFCSFEPSQFDAARPAPRDSHTFIIPFFGVGAAFNSAPYQRNSWPFTVTGYVKHVGAIPTSGRQEDGAARRTNSTRWCGRSRRSALGRGAGPRVRGL